MLDRIGGRQLDVNSLGQKLVGSVAVTNLGWVADQRAGGTDHHNHGDVSPQSLVDIMAVEASSALELAERLFGYLFFISLLLPISKLGRKFDQSVSGARKVGLSAPAPRQDSLDDGGHGGQYNEADQHGRQGHPAAARVQRFVH